MGSIWRYLGRTCQQHAGAFGAGAIAFAILVTLPIPGVSALVSVESVPPVVVALVGVLAVGLAVQSLAVQPKPVERTPPRDREPRGGSRVGWNVEQTLELLERDATTSTRFRSYVARGELKSELEGTVMDILIGHGVDPWTARKQVKRGTWTDDPRAAAFLGDEAPKPPLSLRVEDWATGAGYRVQAERAIETVAALAAGEGKI